MAAQRKELFFSIHAMQCCGGVFVVLFLLLCLCGGAFVVVFLWWCFCAGVFVLVFCGVVAVVWWRWCSSGGVFVVVFLWWCTKYCSSTTEYYSVLQSTTPYSKVLLQYYSNITLYYKVLLQYYSVRQSTTPTSETMSERRPSNTTPYYASTTKASKTSISCEASATFHRTRFQNERFARCFRQFSQKKLVSCEASSKFHRRSFQNERFARGFLQISQNHASKTSVSHDASDNFARKNFQNDRFVRGFFQISQNKLPKRAFRAMLPTIFTKNLRFATVSRNRHTASCERVHPPKAKCASHYNAVHSQMWQCAFRHSAVHKNVWIYPPWTDPLRAHKNVRFYYSFGRSTPRFLREGWPAENELCVSLQFWAIDTTFLARGLTESKWNLRFATVLGDRHHVFIERVARRQMKFAFRYSFGRSTPRFDREGWPRANEICVSLQFWAIDTTFLARGLLSGWPSPSRPAE